ncbi:hypothetical protein BKA83DRAFT_4128264 [Pisolithus microcarpus]|nr:hypothetical protein BKA83DRAFT_4128264 [Pisolithus microcarpus]
MASQEGKEVMFNLLCDTTTECGLSMGLGPICLDELMFWMEKQSLQLITLTVQVAWTTLMEGTLDSRGLPEEPLHTVGRHLPAGVEASNMPRHADILSTETPPSAAHIVTQTWVIAILEHYFGDATL